MATKYRTRSLVGPFLPGTVVTQEQIENAGGEFDRLKGNGTLEEFKGDPEPEPVIKNDEATKADIERRLREESARRGPLSKEEQDNVVAEVTGTNAERNAEAAKQRARVAPPPGGVGANTGEGDNRTLHGHRLSVYRNKVGNRTGNDRLEALKTFDGVGDAKAQEIADALDGKA